MACCLEIRAGGERNEEKPGDTVWLQEPAGGSGGTVGAKDVGEDGPEVLVLRQLVHHLRQAPGRHFKEEGQALGQTRVDEELGQGGGAELQESQEPNAPPDFLRRDDGKNLTDKDKANQRVIMFK